MNCKPFKMPEGSNQHLKCNTTLFQYLDTKSKCTWKYIIGIFYLHILVVTNATPSSNSFWFLSFSAKTFAIAMPKSSATFINLLTVDVSNWLSKSFHMISRRSSSKLLKIRVKLLQKMVENKLLIKIVYTYSFTIFF